MFSNGIVVLTVLALALLLAVGANTNNLVPFYAIGVFTGFSMAGFGMVRYHLRQREQGWRRRLPTPPASPAGTESKPAGRPGGTARLKPEDPVNRRETAVRRQDRS